MPTPHLAPIDESVKLPKSVLDAAAKANAFYGTPPAAPAETPPKPAADAAPQPVVAQDNAPAAPVGQVAQPQPPVPAQVAPPVQPEVPAAAPVAQTAEPPAPPVTPAAPADPSDDNVSPDQWRHRYFSMKGRFEQSERSILTLQDQLTQIGDELVRTQQLINRPAPAQNAPVNPPAPLVTDAEREAYGADFIGVVERAAQQAIQPRISELEAKNQRLENELRTTRQATVSETLDDKIPDWRTINRSQEFLRWLSLRDVYSGQVRREMLSAAYQAANAPRVLAFFQGFLRDAQITTGTTPAPSNQPQPPAPRTPAVDLVDLAAPGRARPAPGEQTHVPAEKPVYTRAEVKRFYDDVRKGVFAGREQEKNLFEQQLVLATREGRVR